MDFTGVPGLFGVIVARRLATLHELQTVYSLEDALSMGEIIAVQNYNEWVALEAAKKK